MDDADNFMAGASPEEDKLTSKIGDYAKENVDLFADFGDDLDDEQDKGPESNEREEILRQKYDEFFTSESDEIEDDLIDGESSDSDSDSGRISPNSFD